MSSLALALQQTRDFEPLIDHIRADLQEVDTGNPEKAEIFYRRVMGMDLWYDQTMIVGGQVLPAGEAGATRALEILEAEITRTMAILGTPTISDITRA